MSSGTAQRAQKSLCLQELLQNSFSLKSSVEFHSCRSVCAGRAEAGFPPAEDSSAHRSCWMAAQPCGNPARPGCRETFSGWENGFVIALLYHKHFKTCLLLLRVLVCTVLPETQRGVQTASKAVQCCSAMENKADFAQKLWSSTACLHEEWIVWCLMHRLNRGHPEGKAPHERFWK